MVKIASGQEVMRSLESVFVEPVSRVLEAWSQRESAGQVDWVISEAGRYAFKWANHMRELTVLGSWPDSVNGTGVKHRICKWQMGCSV
jgi:hypothetical protein